MSHPFGIDAAGVPGEGRGARLQRSLVDLLAAAPDLEAAAVVSFDGLPMASALPVGMDEDRVAAMSAALLSLGEKAADGLGRGGLAQVWVEGDHGTVFLVSAADEAVLVAVAAPRAKTGLMLWEVRHAAADIGALLVERTSASSVSWLPAAPEPRAEPSAGPWPVPSVPEPFGSPAPTATAVLPPPVDPPYAVADLPAPVEPPYLAAVEPPAPVDPPYAVADLPARVEPLYEPYGPDPLALDGLAVAPVEPVAGESVPDWEAPSWTAGEWSAPPRADDPWTP